MARWLMILPVLLFPFPVLAQAFSPPACVESLPQGGKQPRQWTKFRVLLRSPEDVRGKIVLDEEMEPYAVDVTASAETGLFAWSKFTVVYSADGEFLGVGANARGDASHVRGIRLASAIGSKNFPDAVSYLTMHPEGIESTFHLHDPWSDLNLCFVRTLNTAFEHNLEQEVNRTVAEAPSLFLKKLAFVARESMPYGKLDFVRQGDGRSEFLMDDSLYVVDGVAYNDFDLGNLMWGLAMRKLGIPLVLVIMGSQINGFFNSVGQNENGPGIVLIGDSILDQQAIRRGYNRGGSKANSPSFSGDDTLRK